MYLPIEKITKIAISYGSTRLYISGSAVENPREARGIDFACDGVSGWKLYELAARLENEMDIPFDIAPLSPANEFTCLIERHGMRLI
jgi:uncharacterized protein